MQENNLDLKETITKLRREVVDEQVKTQKAEETIKQQNLDMQDLRQAAGPTADLIQKLRDEVENYKQGELSLRKELHASRQQIKQVGTKHSRGFRGSSSSFLPFSANSPHGCIVTDLRSSLAAHRPRHG